MSDEGGRRREDAVSLGEVARGVARIELEIRDLKAGFVTKEAYEADRKADQRAWLVTERDITDLKQRGQRALQIAVGSFLAPIIVSLVVYLLTRGGG